MDWLQLFTILGTFSIGIIGLILTVFSIWYMTSQEMKDFHGRLCALEEKYFQLIIKNKGE